MNAAFLHDFFDDFFDWLNFFLFLTIFSFKTHKVFFLKKIGKVVSLELIFIFEYLITDFSWYFEDKTVKVLNLIAGPLVRSSFDSDHSIYLVREKGSLEKDFILHTSIALRVSCFGFVFHRATFVMVPSVTSRTFKQVNNRF